MNRFRPLPIAIFCAAAAVVAANTGEWVAAVWLTFAAVLFAVGSIPWR